MTPVSRLRIIGGLMLTVAMLIIGQMIRIQNSAQAQELIEIFDETYNRQVRIITPERGNIYDCWGNLLAGNVQVYEVGVAPNQVINPRTIAEDLSTILGLDYQEVYTKANSYIESGNLSYEFLVDFIPAEKIRQLEELQASYAEMESPKDSIRPSLTGVHWVAHLRRSYPENTMGSNILGFYSYLDRSTGRGFYGLEEQYNNLLSGTKQQVVIPMNPTEVEEMPEIPPGSSLILTIDRRIQASMEKIIQDAVEESGSESGTIIIMDPDTGEILAMAVTPEFNPNEYWKQGEIFPVGEPFNRAIGELYEPGSVFKVLTMAAALDAGAVKPETQFIDTGAIQVGGIWIYNWDRGAWGPQDMTGCLQHSLNVCLSWVATELGPTKFYEYLQNFGIGRYSGIDLSGEAVYPLSLPGDSTWYPVNLATNSFGQGVATTPMQMITAIAAIANDGKMMSPHVVKAYIQDGVQYDVKPRMVRQVVSAETAHTLTDMLAISLEDEASSALVEGYRVAGKTGTGEIPTPTGYASDITNASFVGWGPVDNPQFIVYIWLEKPSSSPWGSVVAAPVFSQAVQELVILMGLPPDTTRQELGEP